MFDRLWLLVLIFLFYAYHVLFFIKYNVVSRISMTMLAFLEFVYCACATDLDYNQVCSELT